jgi:lysozyme
MINKKGIALIKKFESLHDGDLKKIGLQPKMDPVGIWTEGYGRAMRDKKGKFIKGAANKDLAYALQTINTEAEAEAALLIDLRTYEDIVERKVKVPITENQRSALVSHTYNTGGSATLFDLINKKALSGEIFHWFTSKYITADGVKLNGLVNRRKAEAELFFTP